MLTDWCKTVGRDPAAIERTVSVEQKDVPGNLDAYAGVGATYIILGIGDPWDFDLVQELVSWRDAAN